MSVIITGMKMPINCVECNEKGIRNILDCDLIFSGCANCGRHPKCPLKSVEGLIEEIQRMPNDNPSYWYTCDVLDRDSVIDTVKEYCGMEEI